MEIDLAGGKYTIIQDESGLRALRHGVLWRDCRGDKLILALAQEIEHQREINTALLRGNLGMQEPANVPE